MPTVRVQTSAKPIPVTLYTRGRAPATWHWYFSFRGRHRGCTGLTDLKAATAQAIQAVHTAVAHTGLPGGLPLSTATAAYLSGRWPGLDTTQPRGQLPRHYTGADERLAQFTAAAGLPEPDLARLTLDETTALIQRYLDARRQTCQPRTVRNDQRVLSAFFAYLLRTPDLKSLLSYRLNPADSKFLTLDPTPSHPQPPPAEQHIGTLIAHGRASTAWPAILLCLTAGFRPIGTTRIRWADVDLDAAAIGADARLGVTEKNRKRWLTLPRWVAQELQAWREQHPQDEYLSPPERHKIHNALALLRRQLGLPKDVTLQSLRRSFISRCMDAGIETQAVAGVAGNSPAVIARHYKDLATLKQTKITQVMETLPQILPQPKIAQS